MLSEIKRKKQSAKMDRLKFHVGPAQEARFDWSIVSGFPTWTTKTDNSNFDLLLLHLETSLEHMLIEPSFAYVTSRKQHVCLQSLDVYSPIKFSVLQHSF
jgi:hypothetical protein